MIESLFHGMKDAAIGAIILNTKLNTSHFNFLLQLIQSKTLNQI